MRGSSEQGKSSANPALESFSSGKNWGLILLALFGATAPEGVVWYTGQFYALFYMTTVLKIDYVTVYIIMMIALTAAAPFFIVFGALSDRIGRRNIMTLGFAFAVVTYWPVFTWLGTYKDNPVILTILVFYLVILVTMVYGPIAAFLVELFPAQDPLHLDVVALPYRQWRLRRTRSVRRRLDRRDVRRRARAGCSIRSASPLSASSSASPASRARPSTSRSGTRSAARRWSRISRSRNGKRRGSTSGAPDPGLLRAAPRAAPRAPASRRGFLFSPIKPRSSRLASSRRSRNLRVDAFDFDLPPSLIATKPAEPRDAARLLVVAGGGGWGLPRHRSAAPAARRRRHGVQRHARHPGAAHRAAGRGAHRADAASPDRRAAVARLRQGRPPAPSGRPGRFRGAGRSRFRRGNRREEPAPAT